MVKHLSTMRETWVWSLGWKVPPEKGTATHSSILAWRIPWTEYSMGSQRVGHDWANFHSLKQSIINPDSLVFQEGGLSLEKQINWVPQQDFLVSLQTGSESTGFPFQGLGFGGRKGFGWRWGDGNDAEPPKIVWGSCQLQTSTGGKVSASQCRGLRRHGFDPWVRKIPWSRK